MSVRLRVVALIAWVLLAAAPAAFAGPVATPEIDRALERSLVVPGTSLARTAAIAIDLRTGETLYEYDADRPMIPASNQKLPVTLSALVQLGPSFRFRTDLVGVGMRQGPTWLGDLVLEGYGDPTFDTTRLRRLVAVVRSRGIRRVTGDVLGDETAFDAEREPRGWKPSFLGDESPALSALVLDRGRGWPAFSPPMLAARALHAALEEAGIEVDGLPGVGAAPDGTETPVLATSASAPLSEIVALANTESDNFVAEMLLKQLGALDTGFGSTDAGAAVVLRTLEELGIPTEGLRIVDGSGLSRLDRLTPRSLVAIVRAGLRTPGVGPAFRRSLAVAGRTGTLERRLYPLEGRVRAKTGTTSLAASLTGTISSRIAFSVIENGTPVSTVAAREAQDRFALLLARTFR